MSITSQTPIPTDLPCARCRYNLRGLPPDSRCPECGAPVQESIEYHNPARPFNLTRLSLGAASLALCPVFFWCIRLIPIANPYGNLSFFTSIADALWFIICLCSGTVITATSKTNISVRNRRLIIGLVVTDCLIEIAWLTLRCLGRFKVIHRTPLAVYTIFSGLSGVQVAVEITLLVAALRLTLDLARLYNRPVIRTLSWIALPGCTIFLLYGLFQTVLQIADDLDWLSVPWSGFLHSEQSQLPANPFHIVHFLYWFIIAFTAWRMHRFKSHSHLPLPRPTPNPKEPS